jgi:hypothetical protein
MLIWWIVGVIVSGALFALGIIMLWYWLVFISLVVLPLVAVWGMVSSGPGSPYNPYPEHH